MRTLVRNKDLRQDMAFKYFLTQQEGLDSVLGNVSLYSWAYQSLSTAIDPKNISYDMLKAVAKSGLESTAGSEPEQFVINIPEVDSAEAFQKDLDERLQMLDSLKTQFASQAEVNRKEAEQVKSIGNALQALSSINFNDTF